MPAPRPVYRQLSAIRLDFSPSHQQPSAIRVVVATVVAIAGSLIADALLVAIGTALFPTTKGYVHFQFSDYAKLTVIGVLIACAAWPIVTRVTSLPTWLFTRLAVLVTLVLLLPDVWLLRQHQPRDAVIVLVLMHVAIAFVTYFALVRIAPAGRKRASVRHSR